MEKEELGKKISEGLSKSWERRKKEDKQNRKRFILNPAEKLEILILNRTGCYTYSDLCKKFNISISVIKRVFNEHVFTEDEIQNGLTSYKYKVLKELEKTKIKESSLRQQIIQKGLLRLNDLVTYNKDIPAEKLSTVISQVQKDLWVSLGQPSEINQINQISDELLNTLIIQMEKQNDTRKQIEPIAKQLPSGEQEFDGIGEGELIIGFKDREREEI